MCALCIFLYDFFFFIFVGVHSVGLWFLHWIPTWLHFSDFFLFSSLPLSWSLFSVLFFFFSLSEYSLNPPTPPPDIKMSLHPPARFHSHTPSPPIYRVFCAYFIFISFVGSNAMQRVLLAETILVDDKPLSVNQFSINKIFSDYLKCIFPCSIWFLAWIK